MKYNEYRRKAKKIRIGSLFTGGDAKLTVQSMTNTPAHDFNATCRQIYQLQAAGCDIVRMAVPDIASAEIFRICRTYCKCGDLTVPLVADIHFDYRIAVACAEAGADKIRINPGNIGAEWKVREVVEACRAHGLPIRIGVNGGSLEKSILQKYGMPTAEALAESALWHAELLEKLGFSDIILSIKSSDVRSMITANRMLAAACDYPLHLGVTEAGTERMGTLKNSVGIGALLCDGIGDTIRISLTADPVCEVNAAEDLLRSIDLWENGGLHIISCPTCGRTKIDIIALSSRLTEAAREIDFHGVKITAAVMGCAVNGPGEAREADIGIAGGDGDALLFRHGVPAHKISESTIIDTLLAEIRQIVADSVEKQALHPEKERQ